MSSLFLISCNSVVVIQHSHRSLLLYIYISVIGHKSFFFFLIMVLQVWAVKIVFEHCTHRWREEISFYKSINPYERFDFNSSNPIQINLHILQINCQLCFWNLQITRKLQKHLRQIINIIFTHIIAHCILSCSTQTNAISSRKHHYSSIFNNDKQKKKICIYWMIRQRHSAFEMINVNKCIHKKYTIKISQYLYCTIAIPNSMKSHFVTTIHREIMAFV